MKNRYHYDKDGDYRGYSSDRSPWDGTPKIAIFIFSFLFFNMAINILKFINDYIANYNSYSFPINIFVGYYYYLTFLLKWVGLSFYITLYYLFNFSSTGYENLNFVIGILLCIVFLFLLYRAIIWIGEELEYNDRVIFIFSKILPVILFLPGVLLLIVLFLQWLFV